MHSAATIVCVFFMIPACRDTRITQLSGRTEVLEPPREIVASGGMLISGHHGLQPCAAAGALKVVIRT